MYVSRRGRRESAVQGAYEGPPRGLGSPSDHPAFPVYDGRISPGKAEAERRFAGTLSRRERTTRSGVLAFAQRDPERRRRTSRSRPPKMSSGVPGAYLPQGAPGSPFRFRRIKKNLSAGFFNPSGGRGTINIFFGFSYYHSLLIFFLNFVTLIFLYTGCLT